MYSTCLWSFFFFGKNYMPLELTLLIYFTNFLPDELTSLPRFLVQNPNLSIPWAFYFQTETFIPFRVQQA
jgi:hypothetical protein